MNKTNFDKYLDEQLKDPAFAARFEQAGREWDLALELAQRREAAGLSQKELAERVGTTQQQISRLERPRYRGSITTLERVADALNLTLDIRLLPKASARKRSSTTVMVREEEGLYKKARKSKKA